MSKGSSDSRSPDRTIRRNEHDRIFGKETPVQKINNHIKRKRELGEKAP